MQSLAVSARDPAAIAAAAALERAGRLAQLIERIVLRDEAALLALYDDTLRQVHAVVLGLTRDASLAEEAVADTYWQAWRQAPRFDPARGRPLAWLLTIARSRALDAQRRHQRFRHGCIDDLPECEMLRDPSPEPPELLSVARELRQLHAALLQLQTSQRELLVLAFFKGLTHEEIALHTALPLGTVKTRIRRALRLLRPLVDGGAGASGRPMV